MRHQSLLRAVVVLAMLSVATTSNAGEMIIRDTTEHSRPMHADVFLLGGFFGYLHFGVGGWFAFPIVPDGFIPALNDAFFIEAGGAVERYSWDWGGGVYDCSYSWWRVTPLGGVRWAFYLTPDWTVFATAKLGYGIGFGSSYECGGVTHIGNEGEPHYSNFAVDGAFGAFWNFSDTWALRLELGYFGASVGAGMDLGTP